MKAVVMNNQNPVSYEAPKVESTVAVEALMTWGHKRKRGHHGGGSGNHSPS